MMKRGRKSVGELSTLAIGIDPKSRPEPPSGLSPREAKQWREIVGSLRADWFTPESLPLLADYVRYAELSTKLSRELRGVAVADPRFAPLLKQKLAASNWVIRLAVKLRLTPQSTRAASTNRRAVVPPHGPPTPTFSGWDWPQ